MHEEKSAWREDGEKYEDHSMNKRNKEDKEYEGMREHDAAANNKVTVTVESGGSHNPGSHNPGSKMGGGKGGHAGLLY